MRTTITIDDDLLAEVKVMAARQHRTIGSVMEEALSAHLRQVREAEQRERVRLPRHRFRGGLRPGVDLFDKELMADVLGDNDPAVAR